MLIYLIDQASWHAHNVPKPQRGLTMRAHGSRLHNNNVPKPRIEILYLKIPIKSLNETKCQLADMSEFLAKVKAAY